MRDAPEWSECASVVGVRDPGFGCRGATGKGHEPMARDTPGSRDLSIPFDPPSGDGGVIH